MQLYNICDIREEMGEYTLDFGHTLECASPNVDVTICEPYDSPSKQTLPFPFLLSKPPDSKQPAPPDCLRVFPSPHPSMHYQSWDSRAGILPVWVLQSSSVRYGSLAPLDQAACRETPGLAGHVKHLQAVSYGVFAERSWLKPRVLRQPSLCVPKYDVLLCCGWTRYR